MDAVNLFTDPKLGFEYSRALRLNIFSKFCYRMINEPDFSSRIRNLYRESFDKTNTTKAIFKKYFDVEYDCDELKELNNWVWAFLLKKDYRISIPHEVKDQLFEVQNGKCAICDCTISNDSTSHVDHIIPWKLVGDELDDNYQLLCAKCNLEKNSKTDYILKSMMKLI